MQALLIIDMQKWMFRYPERLAQVEGLTSRITELVNLFEKKNLPTFEIKTVLSPNKSNWSRLMLKYDYPCLLEGTEDIDPIDGYIPSKRSIIVEKTRNSAFLNTNLNDKLRELGIEKLYLAGVFIDGCIGLTAADAAQLGFEVTFIEDAIGTAEEDLRAPLFKWLIDDYELSSISKQDLLDEFSQ